MILLLSACTGNNNEDKDQSEASNSSCRTTVSTTIDNSTTVGCSASGTLKEIPQRRIDHADCDLNKNDDNNKNNSTSSYKNNNLYVSKNNDETTSNPATTTTTTTTIQQRIDLMDLLRFVENPFEINDDDDDDESTNDNNNYNKIETKSNTNLVDTTIIDTDSTLQSPLRSTTNELIVPSKDDIIIEIRSNDDGAASTTATLSPRHIHWPGNIQFQQLVQEHYRQLGIDIPTTTTILPKITTNATPKVSSKKKSIVITQSMIPQESMIKKARSKRKQLKPICCSCRPTQEQRKELATSIRQLMIVNGQRFFYNPVCSCTNRHLCYCSVHSWNIVEDNRIQHMIEQLLEPKDELPCMDHPTVVIPTDATTILTASTKTTTTKTKTTTEQEPLPSDPIVNMKDSASNDTKRSIKRRQLRRQSELEDQQQQQNVQEEQQQQQQQQEKPHPSIQVPMETSKRARRTFVPLLQLESKRHDKKKKIKRRKQQKRYHEQVQQQQDQQDENDEEQQYNGQHDNTPNDIPTMTGPLHQKKLKLKLYSSEVRKYNPENEKQARDGLSLSDTVKLRKRNVVQRLQDQSSPEQQLSPNMPHAEPIQPLAEILEKKSDFCIKFKLLKPPPVQDFDDVMQHAVPAQPIAEIIEEISEFCIKFRFLKPPPATEAITTTTTQEHDDVIQHREPVQPLAEIMEEESEFCIKFKVLKPPPATQQIATTTSQEHDDVNNNVTKMVSKKRKYQQKVSVTEKPSIEDTNDPELVNDGQMIDDTTKDADPIVDIVGEQKPAATLGELPTPVVYATLRKKQDVLIVGEKTDCLKFYPSWPGNIYFHTVLANYYDIRCNEIRASMLKRNASNIVPSVQNNVNTIDIGNPIVTSKEDWEIVANDVIEEINRVGGQFLQRHKTDFEGNPQESSITSTQVPLDPSVQNNTWIVLQSSSYVSEIICKVLRKKVFSEQQSGALRVSVGTQVSYNAVVIPKAKKQKPETTTDSSGSFVKKGNSFEDVVTSDDTESMGSLTGSSLENVFASSTSINESKRACSSTNSLDQPIEENTDNTSQLSLDPQDDTDDDDDGDGLYVNDLMTDPDPASDGDEYYQIEPGPTPEQMQRLRELFDICARIKINDPSVTCADIDYSFTTEMITVLGTTLYETLQENETQQLVKAMGLETIKFREELLPNNKRGGPYKQLFDYLELSPVLHTVFLNGCHITNIAVGERFIRALSKTQSLKYLIICNMSFSLKSFTSLLHNAKALETLELEGCVLVPDNGGNSFPLITNSHPVRNEALKDITFRGPEMFQDACFIPILSELSICDSLEKISCIHVDNTDIQDNSPRNSDISTEVWSALSDIIIRCETVNHLSFSRWMFQSKELEPIVKALRTRKPKQFQISLAASCRVDIGASSTFMSLFNNGQNEGTSRTLQCASSNNGGASILFIGHGCKLWRSIPAVVRILFDHPNNSINDLRLRSLGTTDLEIIIRNIALVSDSLKNLDLGSICTWDSRRLRVLIHYLPWFHKVRELTLHVNGEENSPKSAIAPLKTELLRAFEKNDSLVAVNFPYCEDEYRDDGSTPPRSLFWTAKELNLLNGYLARNKFASECKSAVDKEIIFPVFASCMLKTAYGCSTIFQHLLSITEHDFSCSSKKEASDSKECSSTVKESPYNEPTQTTVILKDEETHFTDYLPVTRSRRARKAALTKGVLISDSKESSLVVAAKEIFNDELKQTMGTQETREGHDVTDHLSKPRSRRSRKSYLVKEDSRSDSEESWNELSKNKRSETTVVPKDPVTHGFLDPLPKSRSRGAKKSATKKVDPGSDSMVNPPIETAKELPGDEQTQTAVVSETTHDSTSMDHFRTTRPRRARKSAVETEDFVFW